ncbi:hypothetical protein [Nitratidesulfovibrio sp.]|uniref:dCTP deaminase domain-containing protein n=1 Tax=Nitratidesulfovibrio sp. TaxID=2802297 RepID=UPI003340E6BD
MAISPRNVINNGFVIDGTASNLRSGSYDVIVDAIVCDGNVVESGEYTLEPQQMVVVVSKERICLDDSHIAFAHPKTSLCRSGILALNTGIIDPGYDGHISTVIINFRKRAYTIKKGESFLRIVFHKFCEDNAIMFGRRGSGRSKYIKSVIEDTKVYPSTFLDVEGVADGVVKRVHEEVFGKFITKIVSYTSLFVAVVTAFGFYVAWMQYNMQNRALDFVQVEARDDIKSMNVEISRLKERLSVVEGGGDVHRK